MMPVFDPGEEIVGRIASSFQLIDRGIEFLEPEQTFANCARCIAVTA